MQQTRATPGRSPALRVTADHIELREPARPGAEIALDGRPAFPVSRFLDGRRRVVWPGGVRLRLSGLGVVRVGLLDADGSERASAEHDFGGSETWQHPVDARGRPLRVNKWGWFGLMLGERSGEERAQALDVVADVIAMLGARGRPAWLAGGTALGAIRSGRLIDHDDDLDIAYLSAFEQPTQVAAESFSVERALEDHGFHTRRFTTAHFQIVGWPGAGPDPIHVDVFSAFFHGGHLHQPFHIRGPLRPDELLPLRSAELEGRHLPVPFDPAAWLTLNYGPDWAEPQPDHRLVTPRSTRVLFTTWFGQYLRNIEYWEERERLDAARQAPADSALRLAAQLAPGTAVIELGAGDGRDAQHLAEHGFGVLAVDFRYPPGSPADVVCIPGRGVTTLHGDVADGRCLLRLAAAAHRSGRPVHVHSRFLLDQLDSPSRRAVLALLSRLPEGSTMSAEVRVGPTTVPAGQDPAGAALSRRTLDQDAARAGVRWEALTEPGGSRDSTALLLARKETDVSARVIDRLRRAPRSLRELKAEAAQWRLMPVRLAELQDVVDHQLLLTDPPGVGVVPGPVEDPAPTDDRRETA